MTSGPATPERSYSTDEWLDSVPTSGEAGRFPRAALDRLLNGMRAVVDGAGGSFSMRYTTVVVTARSLRENGEEMVPPQH